jgi:hypothetical protein
MALTTSRVLASGCAALLVFSSAAARADAVVVAKHENLEHRTVNSPAPATESYSPFFTLHTDGVKPFSPSNGWAPIAPVQAADPATAMSTTPKKSFTFVGDSTAAGNWTDGNGIPAGITLTFDAQFTISALQTEPGMMLTVPGASDTNQSGRGIGVTVVPGGADDINPGRGLQFSPVTVSNVSFTGTLADPGYSFTPGGVSNFGVQLFASGVFNETSQGMLLTQGEDTIVDPGEETIGFGVTSGTLASNLRQDLNFGIYDDPAPDPLLSSSAFPRQSGPFTLVTTASSGTIRGFTLGYDVTYDITAGSADDADFDGDGDVDGADFLAWQRGVGVGTDLSTGDANDDNVVDGDDLAIWRDQFGPTASIAAVAQIPEPAGAALLVTGSIAMLAASRRRS